MNKRLLFEIHGWIGINLSIFFFIVCFSGTLASLSREMDWLFTPSARAVPTDFLVSRNQLVRNIAAAYPNGKILEWPAATEPYSSQVVELESHRKRRYVFVNQYTGEVQGETRLTFQRFFRDFHYFLFMPFYKFGYFVVLAFSFILLIATATALFFYKKWWTKLFELKIKNGPLVFFRSLHRLVGVWSVPFTMLFSITAIWYFLERTNVANVGGTADPDEPTIADMRLDSAALRSLSYRIDYNRAEIIAESVIEGLIVKDITLPKKNDEVIYLTGDTGELLVRNRANRVYLHPVTYEVIGIRKATETNTVTWLNDIADPIHFGNWGGLLTKVIWFLAGMAISGLILTGIWIALKRRAKNKKRYLPLLKYLNWALAWVMIGSMYFMLYDEYGVSARVYAIVGLGIAVLIISAWYVFDYRLSKQKPR